MIPKELKKYKPTYFSHGKRSNIYTFIKNKKTYVIKAKKPESKAIDRIKNEAKYLKILNQYNIGPKLIKSGEDYIIYEFIKGKFIEEYLKTSKNPIPILIQALKQCWVLDKLKINKLEMHHPYKHIIVYKRKATMIDFERCYNTEKPKNVSQYCEYLRRIGLKGRLTLLSKRYKENPTNKNFQTIINEIKTKNVWKVQKS